MHRGISLEILQSRLARFVRRGRVLCVLTLLLFFFWSQLSSASIFVIFPQECTYRAFCSYRSYPQLPFFLFFDSSLSFSSAPLPETSHHSLNGDGGSDLISKKLQRADLRYARIYTNKGATLRPASYINKTEGYRVLNTRVVSLGWDGRRGRGGTVAKRRGDSPRNITNGLRMARSSCMGYTLSSMICTGFPLFPIAFFPYSTSVPDESTIFPLQGNILEFVERCG